MALAVQRCCFPLVGSNQDRCTGNDISCAPLSPVSSLCFIHSQFDIPLHEQIMHPAYGTISFMGCSTFGVTVTPKETQCTHWVEPLQNHTQKPQLAFQQLFDSRSCQCSPKDKHVQNLRIISPHPWMRWHLPSNIS